MRLTNQTLARGQIRFCHVNINQMFQLLQSLTGPKCKKFEVTGLFSIRKNDGTGTKIGITTGLTKNFPIFLDNQYFLSQSADRVFFQKITFGSLNNP